MSHVFHKLKLCLWKNTQQLLMLDKNMLQISKRYVLQRRMYTLIKKARICYPNLEGKLISCKGYSSSVDEDFIEEVQSLDEIEALKTELEEKDNPRKFLYSKNHDQIMELITKSASVQDVFNVIKDYQDLKHYHVCQSVLTLWDLQKAYSNCYLLNLDKLDVNDSLEAMVNEYKKEIQSHPEFNKLLQLVTEHSDSFNTLELACTMFNLKKMGVSINHPAFNKLLEMAHESIQTDLNKWCFKSLSLYTSSFEAKDSLRSVYLTKDLLPYYWQALDNCNSAEDFELITLAMLGIHILLSRNFLDKYVAKLKDLLATDTITPERIRMMTKALVFLNLPHWSRDNSKCIDYVSSFFKDHINALTVPELIILHKTCHVQSSSGYLRQSIKDRAGYFLEQSKNDDRVSTFLKLPDLLLCQVTGSNLNCKISVEKTIQDCIQYAFPSMLIPIYKLLRHLKYSQTSITELFWSKVIDLTLIDNTPDYILLRLIYRYMYFNNVLGNSYRSYKFEQTMIDKCLSMSDDFIFHIPWKLSRILSFLIAYGYDKRHSVNYEVFYNLILKLEGMKEQLDSMDWMILARGLYISQLTHNLSFNDKRKSILMHLDRLVNESTVRLINSKEIRSIDELCCRIKIFHYQHVRFDSEEFYNLISKLDVSQDDLSSRSVREVVVSLKSSKIILPKLLQRVCDYVTQESDNLFGEIVQKLLCLFYTLGYVPETSDFFNTAVNIIERDKNILNCLSLLQVSLALCYFGQLPEKFVKYIFSIEFMERIDREIDSCYLKVKYPTRIRKNLMLLNRAVCLELPQYDVPWFHEKYIQERNILTPQYKSVIYDDVLNTLIRVLGSKDAVRVQHFTPYGYKIDFFAQIDKKNKPVVQTSSSLKNLNTTKIAVSLIDSRAFSRYCNSSATASGSFRIKLIPGGYVLSRKRHLELMGYKIIDIHPSLWNSMHMAEPNEKFNYLHREIFGES